MQTTRTQKEVVKILKHHDLYVQIIVSNKLLLADVFESFKNMCLKIYELDVARFFNTPGLAWQKTFKKTKVKIGLLVDIDMLVMVEKVIRGEIYHSIYPYAEVNNNCRKDSCLQY